MAIDHLSNKEVASALAHALKEWRISPAGAALSQVALAEKSGIGLTPLKRFEKTGAITLRNLIALLRGLGLLDRLEMLMPDPDAPGPLELLAAARKRPQRQRAPRVAKQAASDPAHG